MPELKTLKDMEWRAIWKTINKGHAWSVSLPELKQEAIKDIKHFQKQKEECKHEDALYTPACLECQHKLIGKIDYIKWKNNITEEDLKENE